MTEPPFLLTVNPLVNNPPASTLSSPHIKRSNLAPRNSSDSHALVFERHVFRGNQPSNQKSMAVYEKLLSLINKFPHHLEETLLTDFMRLLVLTNHDFLKERAIWHVTRLVCSHSLIYKQLARSLRLLPEERHLFLRFMHTTLEFPFGTKSVLGIAIGIYPLNTYELFDEKHILMAVQQFVPSTTVVQGSFYSSRNCHDHISLFYIELEKNDGTRFSFSETKLLKESLVNALKLRVEKVVPSLFMTRNEEEVMKTVLILAQELRHRDSLPQVMISFESQSPTELFFTVIVVHLSKSQKQFFEKITMTTSGCTWIPNWIQVVDYLPDRTAKQAVVFHVKMEKNMSLLRSDFSINFYLARKNLISTLQENLGSIRDYNGGLIFQQGERFTEFKKEFARETASHPDLVENFFYSLTPVEVQATLSIKFLKKLFNMCLEAIITPLPKRKSYFFKTETEDSHTFVTVCVRDSSVKDSFLSALSTLELAKPFVSAAVTFQGYYILEYIHKATANYSEKQFVSHIEKAIAEGISKIENTQSLRLAFSNLPVSLDPRIGGDIYSAMVLKMLFEGLMKYGNDGELTYGLCESITISPDAKKYVFHLRKSYWSNETPVTAHDFAYAWKKILSPDFCTPYTYLFYPIKCAKLAKEGKVPLEELGIHVCDNYTLLVELEHPTPYFLGLTALSLYSPVPHYLNIIHPDWAQQTGQSYVCNGPFQLVKRSRTQGLLELIRNPLYWDPKPQQPDQILLIQGNEHTALEMFKNDEIDWLGSPFQTWNYQLFREYQDQVESLFSSGVFWTMFNTKRFPFHNIKLRQAFAFAICRKEIAEAFGYDGPPAFSPLPFTHSQVNQTDNIDGDEVRAVQLFNEALNELEITKEEFPSLSVVHGVQDPVLSDIIQFLISRWEQLFSIDCKVERHTWKTYFDRVIQGDFQISFTLWEAWVDDPIYTLNAFKYGDEKINSSRWENKLFQEFLDIADETTNEKERHEFLAEAEAILIEEMPVIPLLYEIQHFVRKKYVDVPIHKNTAVFDFRSTLIHGSLSNRVLL